MGPFLPMKEKEASLPPPPTPLPPLLADDDGADRSMVPLGTRQRSILSEEEDSMRCTNDVLPADLSFKAAHHSVRPLLTLYRQRLLRLVRVLEQVGLLDATPFCRDVIGAGNVLTWEVQV